MISADDNPLNEPSVKPRPYLWRLAVLLLAAVGPWLLLWVLFECVPDLLGWEFL